MVSAKAETAPPDRQSRSIQFQSADGEFVGSPFLTVCGVPKGTPFLLGLKMERSGAAEWFEVKKDGECETVDLDWWGKWSESGLWWSVWNEIVDKIMIIVVDLA